MDHQNHHSSSSTSRSSLPGLALPDHHHHHHQALQNNQPTTPSRYESQKRRDWNTFGQYLRNQRPPVALAHCNFNHVMDFLRYLDQFGKTKVHMQGCMFYGQPEPPAPCPCPLRQAWGSLDSLIGRLRAAYEENGGSPDTNPFASSSIKVYLREVKECQAKARGIPYKKKKRTVAGPATAGVVMAGAGGTSEATAVAVAGMGTMGMMGLRDHQSSSSSSSASSSRFS